jgi:CRP-like cAMP-binding protein
LIYNKSSEIGYVESMKLFNSCSNDLQLEILDNILYRVFTEGDYLFQKREYIGGIYVIESGCIKIFSSTQEKEKIFSFLGSGDVIGMNTLFENRISDFTAIAHTDSTVCYIPKEIILKAINQCPSVFLSLLKNLNEKVDSVEDRSTVIMTDTAEKIVVKTLATLKEKFGVDEQGYLKLNLPVRDLANYMCMSKTNLYRILNNLSEKLILEYDEDRYKLMKS